MVSKNIPAPAESVARDGPAFFTGQMRSGKDYVGSRIDGREVVKLSSAMWAVVELFFGEEFSKDQPGVRGLMQSVGRLGRGDFGSGFHPTAERAGLMQSVRDHGDRLNEILRSSEGSYQVGTNVKHRVPAYPPVDWSRFGKTEDFWLDILCSHLDKRREANEDLPAPVVTDVRYPNSMKRLLDRGFGHLHITAGEETRIERGAPPDRPDRTERLGQELDAVWQSPSEAPHGEMAETLADVCPKALQRVASGASVIWSDPETETPSNLTGADDLISLSKIYPAYAVVKR